MLFNLSMKNLRKSISDYTIYFFTLLLGVSIFYMFNAIEDQTVMMELSRAKSNMISIMNTGMSVMSVLVSVILGFLIVYASQFLIRRRTKEFGIYLTLGMRKSSIARMLFLENFVVGLLSLCAGLVLGIAGSQFMSLLVSGMFDADMEKYVFVVSKTAIGKTILYYVIIYVVVIVANTISVVRSRLIDLLLANRKKEKIYIQNPLLCMIVFLVACAFLGYAYYHVTAGAENLETEADVLLMMVLGIVGTFLIFWSVSGFVLGAARRCRGFYRKGTNSFVLNETGNRIHSFVLAGSIICLLLFVTICAMSGAFTLKSYKAKILKEKAPIDISMERECADGQSVGAVLESKGFDMEALTETEEMFTWTCPTVLRESVLGDIPTEGSMWEEYMEEPLEIIYASDYNVAARTYDFPEVSLGEGEYLVLCENPESAFNQFRNMTGGLEEITIGAQTLQPVSEKERTGYLMMADNLSYNELVIVPDTVDHTCLTKKKAYLLASYAKEYDTKAFYTYMDDGEFDKQINDGNPFLPEAIRISTQTALADQSVGQSGITVFVALYIGIVFMICSAALLALKSMSDAMDGKDKYKVLSQLGSRRQEVYGALRKQMGMFFGFPLLLAAVHSIFGIQVANEMLAIYKSDSILPSLVLVAVLIVAIYGGYFVVSYHMCKKIIARNQM